MLALWKFIAGDSRLAPVGIALAVALAGLGVRLGWSPALTGSLLVAIVLATLVAACFE